MIDSINKVIFIILFSYVFLNGNDLNGRIGGYVRDSANREPIIFANVMLVGTDLGSATDNHGYYVIPNIPVGTYTLKIMMMGYEPVMEEIVIDPGSDLRLDYEILEKVLDFAEINVTGERQRFEKQVEISRVNISLREIKDLPAFVEADLFRTLQMLPGVSASSDFSSALVVRGGSPDENLILLDGVELYNPYHLGGVFSTFNADAISDAEFLTGGYPPQYGNRTSSVLKITSKEGDSKGGKLFKNSPIGNIFDVSQFRGDVNILTSKFLSEGPIAKGKGSWMLSGRRTYFDKLAALYYQYKNEPMNWKYYFWDTQGKLIYNISKQHRIMFSGYYGRDVVSILLGEGEDDQIDFDWDWGNYTSSFEWRYVPNSKFFSTLHLAKTNYQFDVNLLATSLDSNGVEQRSNFVVFNEISDYTLKETAQWFISSTHTVKAGLEIKKLGMEFNQKFNGSTLYRQHQSPTITSFYVQDKWQANIRLKLLPGIRITKYEFHDKWYIEPRLGAKFLITDNLALKGSWGIFKQFLFTLNDEESLLNIVDFWQPVPRNYHPKSVKHYIIGLEKWIGEGYYTSFEIYHKEYDNTLTRNPNQNVLLDDDDYIEGTGSVDGIEFLIKKTKGKLTGWIGYTYINSERAYDFNSDGDVIRDHGEIYSPRHDQPHTLNIVANYRLSNKNSFGFTLSNSSGQPYTPTVGYVYSQYSSIHGETDLDNPYYSMIELKGNKNSARYPNYFRIDISWRRSITPFGIKGNFKFQVINASNHFNTFFYNWDLEDKTVSAIGMFPFLPTLGVEFEL